VEPVNGLPWRAAAIVTDVVVGQGQQVKSSGAESRDDARTGRKGVSALSR